MRQRLEQHRDLFLLVMLIVLMVVHPMLNQGVAQRLILAVLMLLTLLMAMVAVAHKQGRVWLSLLLLIAAVLSGLTEAFTSFRVFTAIQWGMLVVFFAVIISELFSYLRQSRTITHAHLYTAASIYLLLAMMWFALYSVIEVVRPGSFVHGNAPLTDPRTDLLYFSLVTLTTVGYGDIVPVGGAARSVSALEAGAGVLYVAITVAIIVSAHKRSEE
jgi:hypothetical protein